MNNGRNPAKKRGRPPLRETVHQRRAKLREKTGVSRNTADAIFAINRQLRPDMLDEWVALLDTKETTFTILSSVSRYPYEQQPMMFDLFQRIGSRAAKRWVENELNPPAPEVIAERLIGWLRREFPNVPGEDLTEGLVVAERMASRIFRDEA